MTNMKTTRRRFIGYLGGMAFIPYFACSAKPKARVVIVGGGFGGAVCANYIKLHDPAIEVFLLEKQKDESEFQRETINNVPLGIYIG